MPLLLLLLLFLLYLQESWSPAWIELTPVESILLTLAGHGCCVLFAALAAFRCRRGLQMAPFSRSAILRTFTRDRWRIVLLSTGMFLASLYLLGWGWAIQQEVTGLGTPLVKPLLLLPFLSGMILGWTFYYDAERTAHDMLWVPEDRPYFTRSAYLALQIRHNLMLLVPPLLLMMVQETLQTLFPALVQPDRFPLLNLAVLMGLLGSAVLFMPVILRWFLGLTPLPAGELREHLTATAQRLDFRFSDILLWNTRGTQANALVTGMFPFFRYVVLTDRLVRELDTEEIEAVFGHEVGHIKHHHMAFYTFFLLVSLAVLGAIFDLGAIWLSGNLGGWLPEWGAVLIRQEWFLGITVVYIFLIFGYLSRRCERQADLFGCRVASRSAFIGALEKVAEVNGISREQPGWLSAWQHGSIAQRVAFLRRTELEPALEQRFQRRLAVLKWTLTIVLVGLTAVLLQGEEWNWLRYL